jgi:hypothetical protein
MARVAVDLRPALDLQGNKLCDFGVRVMGVLMVIAAWGEGVNVCLCLPSPLSNRASFAQSTRRNASAWSFRENMLYADGARVLGTSMVISAGGRGLMYACAPTSPSSDGLSSAQNARKNRMLVGVSYTPTLATRPAPPRT